MTRTEIISRYNKLYLGDSWVQSVELKTGEASCRIALDGGSVLKDEGSSIFDPEARFAPALLSFSRVRSISCEGAKSYQLNSCIVNFGAQLSNENDCIEFYFDLTGGTDPDAYMVKVTVVAKDFEFGPFQE